jgi:hypothetical protein
MALNFQSVLDSIQDAQERAAMEAALKKNPDTAQLIRNLDIEAGNGDRYRTWYKDERKPLEDAQAEVVSLRTQLATLQKQNTPPPQPNPEFETEVGEMKLGTLIEKLEAKLRADGFISKQEAEALAEAKALAAAASARSQVYTHGLPAVEGFIALGRKFESDFSKPFPRKEFGEYVDKGLHKTLEEAYEAFFRAQYTDKIKAEAFAQGEAKGTKDTTERLTQQHAAATASSLPGDMGGNSFIASMVGSTPTAPAPTKIDEILNDGSITLSKRGSSSPSPLARAVAAKMKADREAGKSLA